MLFDLQGKRRRVVQGTYLMLAVLMGGGLVFFGIGGDVSGGLFDAFKGGGGGDSDGSSAIEKRVERNERGARAKPRSERPRKELVRDYYQLATAQTGDATKFPKETKDELAKAAAHWQAYLELEPEKPDASLARVALQVYDPNALNRPKQAEEAARLIAQSENNASAYLNLVQYAKLAGDTRTADLAGQKAVDLAPKKQRKAVKAQLKAIENPQPAAQPDSGTPEP
jgi:hypothetical protein